MAEIFQNKHDYCGFGGSVIRLQGLHYMYAQGWLIKEDDKKLWKHFSQCDYCLTELKNILTVLNFAIEKTDISYEDFKRMLEEKNSLSAAPF